MAARGDRARPAGPSLSAFRAPEQDRRRPEPPPSEGAADALPPFLYGAAGAALVLALLTLARLLASSQAGLSQDEAYYWLWSLAPQAGYLDHPPMIAWWIAGGTSLFGDTPLGIRAPSVLAVLIASLAIFRVAWLFAPDERDAVRAMIWFNATLMVGVGALLATPDTPSLLFWTLSLWALAELRRSMDGRWWLAVGVFAGLGLLSKYAGLFLGAGIILWLAVVPEQRRWFRSPWLWAGGALALALFAPVVWWNAGHGWASFAKQFGRAAVDGFSPLTLLELIGSQIGLLGPLMVPFLLLGVGMVVRLRPARAQMAWMLLATSAPFALYLVWHASHDSVQGNWPAPLYAALALLSALAAGACGPGRWRWRARLSRLVAPVGIGCALLAYLHVSTDAAFLTRADPTRQMRGWPTFATALDLARQRAHADWIGTLSYTTTAELAFNLAGRAPVVPLVEPLRYGHLPAAEPALMARPGLVVALQRRAGWVDLGARFGGADDLGTLTRSANGVPVATYRIWRVPDGASLASPRAILSPGG